MMARNSGRCTTRANVPLSGIGAPRARFQGNGTGRLIAKGMSKFKVIARTTAHDRFGIQGYVSPGFDAVRDAFAENFVRRREPGEAWCAFHCIEKVVDLWGGIRNKQTAEAWEQDTMVVVHSATKDWPR